MDYHLKWLSLYLLLTVNGNCYASSFEELNYTTEEYPPYNYTDNGQVTGLSVALLRLTWKELGVKEQKISVLPWAYAITELEIQPNNVLFTTTLTPQRRDKYQWACPIYEKAASSIISLKSNKIKIDSLSDLEEYEVGTIRYDISENILLASNLKVRSNITMEENLELMDRGEIQVIAYDKSIAFNMFKKWGWDSNRFESVYDYGSKTGCYAFSKQVDSSLVEQFQQAFDKVMKTPKAKELYRYFLPNS